MNVNLLSVFEKKNWTLFHTIPALNPFSNKPLFSCVFSKCLLKTLWEKEKHCGKKINGSERAISPLSAMFFYLLVELSTKIFSFFILFKIVVSKIFEFGRV